MKTDEAFSGRRALVIGGSGGIGGAVALGLAERGAALTITGGTSRERLDAALAALNAKPGRRAGGFLCRIGGTDGLSPEQAVKHILDKVPEPDILICAWGPFRRAALEKTGPGDWRFLTESNLVFPGILISSVFGAMLVKGWGRILLFGGAETAETRGYTSTAAYSAAKTALNVLAKSAALAAAGQDITCNVICPGFTNTVYCGEEERRYNDRHSPGGKASGPDDIAAFALKVLENPEINGAVLHAVNPAGAARGIEMP